MMPRRLREFDGRPRNSNGEFAGADTQGIDPMSMHMAYRQPFAPPVAPEAAEAALTPAQKKAKLEQEKKSKLLSVKQFTAIPEHERFNDAVVRAYGRFVKSGLGENRKEAERFNRQLDKAEIRLRGNTYIPEGNLAGGLVGGAAGAIASYKINPKSLPLSLILGASGGLVGAGLGGLVGSRIEKKHKTYPNGVRFSYAGKLKELSFMKKNGTYATALKELSAQRQRMIYFAYDEIDNPFLDTRENVNTNPSYGRFRRNSPFPLDASKDVFAGSSHEAASSYWDRLKRDARSLTRVPFPEHLQPGFIARVKKLKLKK